MCALQYASGIDEDTVLRVCAMHGFEVGMGMTEDEYLDAASDLKLTYKRVHFKHPCTLRQFIRKHPEGLYLVATWDHLFCLDNGIVADPRNDARPGLGRIVKVAHLVTK